MISMETNVPGSNLATRVARVTPSMIWISPPFPRIPTNGGMPDTDLPCSEICPRPFPRIGPGVSGRWQPQQQRVDVNNHCERFYSAIQDQPSLMPAFQPRPAKQVPRIDIAGIRRRPPSRRRTGDRRRGGRSIPGRRRRGGRAGLHAVVAVDAQELVGVLPADLAWFGVRDLGGAAVLRGADVAAKRWSFMQVQESFARSRGLDWFLPMPCGSKYLVSFMPSSAARRFISATNWSAGSPAFPLAKRGPKCSASAVAASLPDGSSRP